MTVSLRTRLVTLYVVAAVALIVLVGGAVTWFGLVSFGYMAQQTATTVAREVPAIVAEETLHRKLDAAAPDIVRRLSQPGILISIRGDEAGYDRPLAFSKSPPDTGGRIPIFPKAAQLPAPPGAPGEGGPLVVAPRTMQIAPPPGDAGRRREEKNFDFPFRLNILLGLHPERVSVPGGTIFIFPDYHPLQNTMSGFWKVLIPVACIAGVGALLLGRYITDQALRPLVETTQSLRRFASGDFTPRPVLASRRDEIGELAQAYNDAAAQVAAAFEERHRAEDRMRQFVADAGHELRTPLTVMMGFIDVLRPRASGDVRLTEGFEIMKTESRRMRSLIDRLIRLARLERSEGSDGAVVERFDLAATARNVASTLGALDGTNRVAIHAAGPVFVEADESEIHDAIANFVENALKYAPGSRVDVRVFESRGNAMVEVEDQGPGLSTDDQRHIFERFYRGEGRNAESEGFGLGLAIVKRTAERAGGAVGVASAPGEGARFWLRLPLAAGAGSEAAVAAPR
jgi:two-component system OmpR family sensor kinase